MVPQEAEALRKAVQKGSLACCARPFLYVCFLVGDIYMSAALVRSSVQTRHTMGQISLPQQPAYGS